MRCVERAREVRGSIWWMRRAEDEDGAKSLSRAESNLVPRLAEGQGGRGTNCTENVLDSEVRVRVRVGGDAFRKM